MAKKIDYTKSPALAFIEPKAEQEQATETKQEPKTKGGKGLRTITIPEGMTLNPDMFIEKRSKRVQIVLRPSVYDKAKAKADRLGISFNEYIHALIDTDIAGE